MQCHIILDLMMRNTNTASYLTFYCNFHLMDPYQALIFPPLHGILNQLPCLIPARKWFAVGRSCLRYRCTTEIR